MATLDPRVDAYIEKAADFAKPILTHLRKIVHTACPDVVETIKWGFPNFDYKGPFCSMASFKNHMAFTFFKAKLMKDEHKVFSSGEGTSSMGHLGKISSLKDLPKDKILIEYLKKAAKLNDEGVKTPRPKASDKKDLIVPDYFIEELKKNKKAEKTFNDFAYSHKKEYIGWITEAKTEATRNKRIETALEWLAEGKSKNWKYERKS